MDETRFRRQCQSLCDQFPAHPRLKTVAAVGAYDGVFGDLDRHDSMRLTYILDYAVRSGIPVDPDFSIDVVNFREGRDFLTETGPADMVFVSYILRDSGSFTDIFRDAAALRKHREYPYNMNWTLSRRHGPFFWAQRLEAAGTKLVATYGGTCEIGSSFFANDCLDLDQVELIPTPEEDCGGPGAPRAWEAKHYPGLGQKHDIPLPWLGMTADRGFLAAISASLSQGTALGRRASAAASGHRAPKP